VIPIWDAAFLRAQFGPKGSTLPLAAYCARNVVGTLFAARQTLRGGATCWCIVDPAYGHLPIQTVGRSAPRARGTVRLVSQR
jgi:hypothetical protein